MTEIYVTQNFNTKQNTAWNSSKWNLQSIILLIICMFIIQLCYKDTAMLILSNTFCLLIRKLKIGKVSQTPNKDHNIVF